jgi:hypothetical protein
VRNLMGGKGFLSRKNSGTYYLCSVVKREVEVGRWSWSWSKRIDFRHAAPLKCLGYSAQMH